MKQILFLMFCCITVIAQGQTISDTASVGAADLKSKNKPEIPTFVPNTIRSMSLPITHGYRMHDLQLRQPFPSRLDFDTVKLNLNLNLSFAQRKSLSQIIKEEPLKAIIYGAAIVAGMLNNNIVGEDKMMRIRMDNAINSRSGIPESAKSANGFVTVKNE